MSTEREQQLLEEIRIRDARIARLEEELARSQAQVRLLLDRVDKLCRRVFGKSSEQIDPAQMELMLSGNSAPQQPAPTEQAQESTAIVPFDVPRRGRKAPVRRLPDDLPVIETVINPPEVVANPERWRQFDEEITTLLDYEPGRFLQHRIIRPKYVSREDNTLAPVIAPLNTLQARCKAAPGLLAYVVTAKYCYHTPLYRIEMMFRVQFGVDIPRQTLDRWVLGVADWLQLIYQHLCEMVFANGYVQIDETHIDYLKPGNGKAKEGFFWVVNAPGVGVAFFWHTSRAAKCLEEIIPEHFTGIIQRDGYIGYEAFAKRRPEGEIVQVACMAHIRRAFFDAKESALGVASWILHQIQLLYRIEAGLRETNAGPAMRQTVRQAQSRMIFERLGRCFERFTDKGRYLPQSPMGKAISYALGQWEAASRFLEDGVIEIDNNLVENAIRPSAVGKKNWLFIGQEDAGKHSAILYTIVENCRILGIDPYAYLKWVLEKLPAATNQQIAELTPAAFVKAKPPPLKQAA